MGVPWRISPVPAGFPKRTTATQAALLPHLTHVLTQGGGWRSLWLVHEVSRQGQEAAATPHSTGKGRGLG